MYEVFSCYLLIYNSSMHSNTMFTSKGNMLIVKRTIASKSTVHNSTVIIIHNTHMHVWTYKLLHERFIRWLKVHSRRFRITVNRFVRCLELEFVARSADWPSDVNFDLLLIRFWTSWLSSRSLLPPVTAETCSANRPRKKETIGKIQRRNSVKQFCNSNVCFTFILLWDVNKWNAYEVAL